MYYGHQDILTHQVMTQLTQQPNEQLQAHHPNYTATYPRPRLNLKSHITSKFFILKPLFKIQTPTGSKRYLLNQNKTVTTLTFRTFMIN